MHVEFPELTPKARAAYDAATSAIRGPVITISIADLRRSYAAFLRRAMNRYGWGYGTPL